MQKRLTTTSGPHFGPTWSKELENDVSAECNNKYGKVVHIAVDANSEGEIVDQIKSRSFHVHVMEYVISFQTLGRRGQGLVPTG